MMVITQMLAMAPIKCQGWTQPLLAAHTALGTALLMQGHLCEAREYLEQELPRVVDQSGGSAAAGGRRHGCAAIAREHARLPWRAQMWYAGDQT